MQQTTQNAPLTQKQAMRIRIEPNERKPAPSASKMSSHNRNAITSVTTLLVAAVLAIGATTALAATGRDAREATIQRVREQQPKLERKDRWERKAITFDSMWRARR